MTVIPDFVLCRFCGEPMYACEDGYECGDENMVWRENCPYFIKHGQGYYMTYKAGRTQWARRVKKESAALNQWLSWASA